MMGANILNLQAVLSSSSSGESGKPTYPHHPITCVGPLAYRPDSGVLQCEHATTDPDDRRTLACVNHSIALLIIERAFAEL